MNKLPRPLHAIPARSCMLTWMMASATAPFPTPFLADILRRIVNQQTHNSCKDGACASSWCGAEDPCVQHCVWNDYV